MSSAMPLSARAQTLLRSYHDSPVENATQTVPQNIRLAVEAALDRGETHYTDRPGLMPLREKIAQRLRAQFSLVLEAKKELIVTCGVTEARFLAIQQVLQPAEVLAAPQGVDALSGVALLRDAVLRQEITADTRMVYLRSSATEAVLRTYLSQTPDTAIILFEIDVPGTKFHPGQLESFAGRTVTIGGLGEESWRIGYLASPSGPSAALQDFKQALTICSTNLSQWASLVELETL